MRPKPAIVLSPIKKEAETVRKKGLPVPKVPKKRNFWEKIEAN
jgi:hypothetical protein